MSQILDCYKAVARAVNWAVNSQGVLNYAHGGQFFTVGGKKLILPTPEFLSAPDWEQFQVFHPLSESVSGSESPVAEKLRGFMIMRLQETLATVLGSIVDVSMNPQIHDSLNAGQRKILAAIPDMKPASAKKLMKILKLADQQDKLIVLYVKRSGTIGNETFHRVCSVRLQVLNEFDQHERTCLGIKLSQTEVKQLPALLDIVLPGINQGKYDFGSKSQFVPYCESLLSTYGNVSNRLNKLTKKFKGHLDFENTWIDTSYMEFIPELAKLSRMVPAMEGNEGIAPEVEKYAQAETAQPKQHWATQDTVVHQPAPVQPVQPQPSQPAYQQPTPPNPPQEPAATVQQHQQAAPAEDDCPMLRQPQPGTAPAYPTQPGYPQPGYPQQPTYPGVPGYPAAPGYPQPGQPAYVPAQQAAQNAPAHRATVAELRERRMYESGQPSAFGYAPQQPQYGVPPGYPVPGYPAGVPQQPVYPQPGYPQQPGQYPQGHVPANWA